MYCNSKLKNRQEAEELSLLDEPQLDRKEAANGFIKSNAENIPEKERAKFIEYVETELLSLHEGNFARYYITPSEFARWKEEWDKS